MTHQSLNSLLSRACEMAQRVKALTAKPDLSWVPEIYMIEIENGLPQIVL